MAQKPTQNETGKATVELVAKKAKVSRAAVYAVLNADRPTNIRIGQDKTRRILQAANELGYVRNELARSLSTGKTFTIGVLVCTLKVHFFTDFFTYLDDACYKDGYSVFITSSENDSQRERRGLQALISKRVDGIVIARGYPGENDDLLQLAAQNGIPVVIIGETDVPNLPYPVVGFDELRVAELITEHLWTMGHRRVVHFDAGKTPDQSVRIHQLRFERFAAAWQRRSGETPQRVCAADSMYSGQELIDYLQTLPADKRPTAVACSTDMLALRAMAVLRNQGLAVPGDISLIGCDDIDAAEQAAVPLTTVRLSSGKIAEGVWSLLHDALRLQNETQTQRKVITPELILRKSTAALVAR